MSQSSKQRYMFGPFLLDPQEQWLLRDGVPVALTRKAFETLLMLVERDGRVVDKEEFLTAIWPDSFVEEGSLTVNISVLRKALGEDRNGERYIETVPRRGYRFIAPVERLNGTAPAATEQAETAAPRVEEETTSAPVDVVAESEPESVVDSAHAVEADAPRTTLLAATGATGVTESPAPVVPRASRRLLLIALVLVAAIGIALFVAVRARRQKAEGVKVLRQVEARIDQSGVIDGESLYKVAQAYAVLGDRAASLRMLRRSIEGGFVCYPYFTSDPLLANVRADSAYAAIIEQARVRHEEFKRNFF
jgi:DNA-binding winged helix-turn-helix (wHTH) protein